MGNGEWGMGNGKSIIKWYFLLPILTKKSQNTVELRSR
jgi:hypothetical protein